MAMSAPATQMWIQVNPVGKEKEDDSEISSCLQKPLEPNQMPQDLRVEEQGEDNMHSASYGVQAAASGVRRWKRSHCRASLALQWERSLLAPPWQ